MYLLSNVGQLEVGGECPDEWDDLVGAQPVEKTFQLLTRLGRSAPPCRLPQGTNLLDTIEKGLTVLANERISELASQPADIAAKSLVGAHIDEAR